MGMWSEAQDSSKLSTPIVSVGNEVSFVNADASGIFLTETHNDCIVEKGEEIGIVVNSLTGEILQSVKAPDRGYLFTIRAHPVVYEGSLLARIHRIQ